MTDKNATVQEGYFNEKYGADIDPWDYVNSPYEAEKYKTTVDALDRRLYKNILEIACSIGILSEKLASKTKHLLCIDIADAPLAVAKKRLAPYPNVAVQKMMVPNQFPTEEFDAIVVSEMAYYLGMDDLKKLGELIIAHLEQSGQLVLVHWLPFVEEHPLTGDEVHEYFLGLSKVGGSLTHVHHQRKEKYRIDVFEKN